MRCCPFRGCCPRIMVLPLRGAFPCGMFTQGVAPFHSACPGLRGAAPSERIDARIDVRFDIVRFDIVLCDVCGLSSSQKSRQGYCKNAVSPKVGRENNARCACFSAKKMLLLHAQRELCTPTYITETSDMEKQTLGLLNGIISGISFGLIPLFSIPVIAAGMGNVSILVYRFLFEIGRAHV